jgi:hypothetical protein
MEATCSFEASVDFQRTTRRYKPEDRNLHNHRCDNLNSHRKKFDEPLTNVTIDMWVETMLMIFKLGEKY